MLVLHGFAWRSSKTQLWYKKTKTNIKQLKKYFKHLKIRKNTEHTSFPRVPWCCLISSLNSLGPTFWVPQPQRVQPFGSNLCQKVQPMSTGPTVAAGPTFISRSNLCQRVPTFSAGPKVSDISSIPNIILYPEI